MFKKNERYSKVHGVGPDDNRNKLDVVGSRLNIGMERVQGELQHLKNSR